MAFGMIVEHLFEPAVSSPAVFAVVATGGVAAPGPEVEKRLVHRSEQRERAHARVRLWCDPAEGLFGVQVRRTIAPGDIRRSLVGQDSMDLAEARGPRRRRLDIARSPSRATKKASRIAPHGYGHPPATQVGSARCGRRLRRRPPVPPNGAVAGVGGRSLDRGPGVCQVGNAPILRASQTPEATVGSDRGSGLLDSWDASVPTHPPHPHHDPYRNGGLAGACPSGGGVPWRFLSPAVRRRRRRCLTMITAPAVPSPMHPSRGPTCRTCSATVHTLPFTSRRGILLPPRTHLCRPDHDLIHLDTRSSRP